MTGWERFFFKPQTTAPMTLVRIGWGALTAIWALSLLPDVDPFLTEGALRYERPAQPGGWNLLPHIGWSGAPLVLCLLLLVASLLTMVGMRTRASSALAVLCLIVLQRANTTVLNSGDLLLRQVGIAVALAPCGLLLSLDALRAQRRGERPNLLRAPYARRLLQLVLAIGYLLSAWAKARGDTWHDGSAVALSLRIEDLQRFVAPEWLFDQAIMLNLFTWASLAFEASFIVLVWPRRSRLWVLGAGVLFHLGIDIFLDVGFFSLAIFLGYLAFLPSELSQRIVDRVGSTRRASDRQVLAVEPSEQHGDSPGVVTQAVPGAVHDA